MDQIYGNARVCFAAAAGESVNSGFLAEYDHSPLVFESPSMVVYGLRNRAHNMRKGDLNHLIPTGQTGPWSNRGWCFQEHIISSRIIVFDKEEMEFECDYGRACECSFLNYIKEDFRLPKARFASFAVIASTSTINRQWLGLMATFCHRKFTVDSDRLVALSGLLNYVRGMLSLCDGTEFLYVAGHWLLPKGSLYVDDLIKSLLW